MGETGIYKVSGGDKKKVNKNELHGRVQTVLGLISPDELGVTLPHEHLFSDFRCYMKEPTDPEQNKLAHQKITMRNLWYARYHRLSSEDNMMFDDEDMAIRELMYFKEAGGNTVVDMTCNNIGRNPTGLIHVAKATGLNIIMGTSYYLALSYTPEMKMDSRTEEDLAGEFIRDITCGVGDTGIKAGIIGEIGCSFPLERGERKVLRAAGIAQQETGAAINIHPGGCPDAPFEYIKILEEVGVNLSRVAFSHMTRTFPISARSARANLAEKGCYLEFDMFGTDGIYPPPIAMGFDVANDAIRITELTELIEDGFLDRILISQDVAYKVFLRAYGGGGYSHILKVIVPQMRGKGLTEEQINTILVDNPKRINTFFS